MKKEEIIKIHHKRGRIHQAMTTITFYLDFPNKEFPVQIEVNNDLEALNTYIETLRENMQEAVDLRNRLFPDATSGSVSFSPASRGRSKRVGDT